MKHLKKILPALIMAALASTGIQAQDECVELQGTPPGLYTTTDEGATYMVKDGKVVEIPAGGAGFANENEVKCIKSPPRFMEWPCSTQAASARRFPTYKLEELEGNNPSREIVQRYFDVPEVIQPFPRWKDGQSHGPFSTDVIMQFSSPEYWYLPDSSQPILMERRPKTLLISLYVGIHKVVVDNNAFKALKEYYGDDDIPVVFEFNNSNVVPISYFGPNVSIEEVKKAYSERGINIADVPMWELGDYHFRASVAEYEKYADIPSLESISPEKQAALKADLEKNGFSRKPIFVTLLGESEQISVDQPERVRVAASMGYTSIPTRVTIIEPDVLVQRCGPGTPTGTSGDAISGDTTPLGGAIVPTESTIVPPPTDPAASDS